MADPFEHFGEQQRSYEMLEEHRELLARDAADVLRKHPGAQPVGVVMEADASEAAELRKMLEQQAGQQVAGFVGVMPRELVLGVLRENHADAVDWFDGDAGEGPRRTLPLVAFTRNGVRLGRTEFEV